MKKITTTLLFPVLFLAACSEDTEMNTYPARSDEAFFETTKYSYTVSADLEDAYRVEVFRANPSGAASIPVTLNTEDPNAASAFTAPATVNFADGEYTTQYTVSFERSKLEIGKETRVNIVLGSQTSLPYSTTCTLSVIRDYTWQSFGTGTYTSAILANLFSSEVSWEQTIEVAQEQPNLYRLPDWYHQAGTKYSEAGYHLTFTWDGGATFTFQAPADESGCVTIETGFVHPSYGMLSLYIDQAADYTYYNAETKTFTINACGLVPYGGSLAQLTDWANDTFKITSTL